MKKILIALVAVAASSAAFAQGSIFSTKGFEKSAWNAKPVIVQVKPVIAAISNKVEKSSSSHRPWVQLPKGFEHASYGKNDKKDRDDDKHGHGKDDKDEHKYGWGKGHDKHDFLKHIKHDKKHWHKKHPISHC